MNRETSISSISNLASLLGEKSPSLLGKYFYDNTDCGVGVEYLSLGESYFSSDNSYGMTRQLPNIWANKIVGIRFHSIVEGYDAEFSADPVYFPCEWGDIEDALDYLEFGVDSFLKEND